MQIDPARGDGELWREAESSPEAFGDLYERHARAVFAFCARQTGDLAMAEDLTSVVFLEAWRRRGSVEVSESALPWLLGTARNVVRNQRRSLWRHRAALGRLQGEAATASEGPEDAAIARLDAQGTLERALGAVQRLPRKQREALNLVVWSGLSYEQAAEALGVPIGTVRSRVARAREALGRADGVPISAIRKECP